MSATLFLALSLMCVENATAQRPFIPLTTMQITEYTEAALPACSNWRLVGICTWLVCDEICWTEVRPRYGHYSPDVVIAAYDYPLENPWVESEAVLEVYNAAFEAVTAGVLDGGVADGGGTVDQSTDGQGVMRFKYADVVGNPALGTLDIGEFMCDPTAEAFEPYFTATSDLVAWRLFDPAGTLESIAHPFALALSITGVPRVLHRDVTTSADGVVPGANWGNTYPRSGFVKQVHPYKAAAVIATKAAAVVTSADPMVWGHVAQSIFVNGSDQMRWLPLEIESGNNATGMWQQLYPYMEASCSVFPDAGDALSAVSPIDPWAHRISEVGNYVWNLWRPYSCCDRPDEGATTLISATGTYP